MHVYAVLAVVAAVGVGGQKLDLSIGGRAANRYHESVFDPNSKLYLFSGGDFRFALFQPERFQA